MGAGWPFRLRRVSPPDPATLELWVDISNYSKELTDQGCADLKAAGVVGVIIQAVTGLDGLSYTRQQLDAATRNGLRIAGYVFPGGLATKLAMFDGYTIEFLWLDLELPISIHAVDQALAMCDAYLGKLTGIYSGRWFFAQQGWLSLTRWSNRALWDSNYDGDPVLADDFRPYGGWTSCVVKQYHGTTDIGAVHELDLDSTYSAA